MKNKVFLVMLLSIAALSAGCNTVAGAGRIYSAAEKRSRTPPRSRLPRQRPFRRRRAASGMPRHAGRGYRRSAPGRCAALTAASGRRMSCPAGHECGLA